MEQGSNIPLERSVSLAEAEASIKKAVLRAGLSIQIDLVGRNVHAARCRLFDESSGTTIATGFGKGPIAASTVGSLFEAAEHLFSKHTYIDSNKIRYLEASEFCLGYPTLNTLPLALLRETPHSCLPFLSYEEIGGNKKHVLPLALSSPGYLDALHTDAELRNRDSFDYCRFEHYSSNSGIAIGMNSTEATIHGLLESMERDSTSRFMVQALILKQKSALRIVDRQTIPPPLGNLVKMVERELGGQIKIFQLPNRFGVPTFCSWVDQREFRLGVAGYGCSLCCDNAISRSLYELAQCHLIGKHFHGRQWLREQDNRVAEQLNGLPLHLRCAEFDLGKCCDEIGFELLNYADLESIDNSGSLNDYLDRLSGRIRSAGEGSFVAAITNIGDGIAINHIFTTHEDRFFNVRHGKPIFPHSLI